MKGYISKYEKAQMKAKGMCPNGTPEEIKRVTKQIFAKLIVGWTTTIGKVNGKLVLTKNSY